MQLPFIQIAIQQFNDLAIQIGHFIHISPIHCIISTIPVGKNGKKTEKSKISPPSFKNIPNECICLRALNACDAVFAAAAQSSQQSNVCRLFVQR